jgi:NAD-dependent dihydropyrimidine dehydrogenase PreA subunit
MSKYGTWKGTPREAIPWHPAVDESACIGCRACFEFCGHGVYSWNEITGKPAVAEPFQCVVGCSNCKGQCPVEAISFPPLSVLKPYLNGEDS